ncbi:MAG: hypothetical protein HY900_03365, partial [Deltaproteobacteria bacterium]|nr:hypothetical protein [Deltaproteobacteria bacterium]
VCIGCHEGISWSEELVSGYLDSKHLVHSTHVSAEETECAKCHNPANDGENFESMVPAENVPAGGLAAVTCEACHGAGQEHFGLGPIPIPRPGVDSCAGGAVGTVGAACHTDLAADPVSAGHEPYHPEGMNIVEKYKSSPHYNEGEAGHASTKCTRCHTDEGAREYVNITSADTLASAVQGPEASPVQCRTCHNPHNPGELLKAESTSTDRTTGVVTVTGSAEYSTCTNCHGSATADLSPSTVVRYSDYPSPSATTDGPLVGGTNGTTTVLLYHGQRWERIIASTHYDYPSTATTIEGFVVRAKDERACRDCHDVHSADVTIQKQWAESGHAGHIAAIKEEAAAASTKDTLDQTKAVQAAGVGETHPTNPTMAWSHYDWDKSYKDDNNADGIAEKDRADCQRCHTATGSKNYLTSPTTYDPANNDFSHLSGWQRNANGADGTTPDPAKGTKVSGQNELLYCWGCHESATTGALLNPGAITIDIYKFKGAPVAYPDVSSSNVCVSCHSGRASGESVIAAVPGTGATPAAWDNVGFVNSHYMASAGLVYAKIAYTNFVPADTPIGSSTYGASLTTPEDGGSLNSTHRKLGTPAIIGDHGITAEDGLDVGGPCVACHMAAGAKNHTWEMGADAFTNVCVKCHDEEAGVPLTADNYNEIFIEEQAIPFEDAISLALAKLEANFNITYNPAAYPYFYDQSAGGGAAKNWTRSNFAGVLGGTLGDADAEKLMGACFNINLLKRDPAAYAHARTYARRLLYDAIDWLDDRTINQSTGATALAWDPVKYVKGEMATSPETTESAKYLMKYSRSTGAWDTTQERP